MPYAIIRGQRLHYQRAGGGPVLLLLHGIGSNSRAFRHQLADLSDTYGVVAWDAPGYGRSAEPAEPFTFDSLADDAAALLDHLGAARAHVLGHSFGGVVAQFLTRRHPERVASLILVDTNPGSGSLPEPERSVRVRRRLESLATMTPRQIAEARAPTLLSPEAPVELVEEMISIMAEIRPAGYRAAAIAMGTTDVSHWLSSIEVPTLVICGEDDDVTPPSTAEQLAHAIPRARLVLIPGAGHASPQERPAAFNAAVRGFLRHVEHTLPVTRIGSAPEDGELSGEGARAPTGTGVETHSMEPRWT